MGRGGGGKDLQQVLCRLVEAPGLSRQTGPGVKQCQTHALDTPVTSTARCSRSWCRFLCSFDARCSSRSASVQNDSPHAVHGTRGGPLPRMVFMINGPGSYFGCVAGNVGGRPILSWLPVLPWREFEVHFFLPLFLPYLTFPYQPWPPKNDNFSGFQIQKASLRHSRNA